MGPVHVNIIGGAAIALLGIGVLAEGAYIVKTRREVAALGGELTELRAHREQGGTAAYRPPTEGQVAAREVPDQGGGAREGERRRTLPPPRFVPAEEPAPGAAPAPGQAALPAALDNPAAREQLRQFVASELERDRQQGRERQREQREAQEQKRIEATAQRLGLNPTETQKFTEVLSSAQTNRRAVMDRVQAGELAGEEIGKQMQAIRQKSDEQLKQLLGDERMKKMQETQRQERGRWGGERGGPGGRGEGQRGAGAPPPANPQ